ncbi:MAG: 4Fe-4S binding protein [Treponema sp.]|nr:4Fe-4S binding protein [Treponema sp.]
MALKIFLSILFLILICLFVIAVANIFLPAVKNQILQNTELLFSPLEKNYIFRNVDNNVPVSQNRAVVFSNPNKKKNPRLQYNGIHNCALIASVYGSLTDNDFDCIGFGDCAAACPQQAIVIQNGTAIVTNECCGCGTCVSACPKQLISMLPKEQKTIQYKNDVENEHIIEIPRKKDFKFWQSWYKILNC